MRKTFKNKIISYFSILIALILSLMLFGCDKTSKSEETYTINWINYDGTILETDNVKKDLIPIYNGSTPIKPSDNTYTYTFAGWDSEVTKCNSDKDYKATYTSTFIEYTVNFYDEDGTTLLKTSKYHYGDVVEEPEVPTKESNNTYTYTFAGWDSEVTKCNSDKNYKATYTPVYIEYTVNFYDEDGTTLLKSAKYHYGDTVEEPEVPTKKPTESTIYTFAGWDSEVTNCNGDKDYKVAYLVTPRKYNVTFVDYDDSILKEKTPYDYGTSASEIVMPLNPTREKDNTYTYTFAGWKPIVENVTKDIIYKATYTPVYIEYTVNFYDEDGTTLLKSTKYHYGDVVEEPEAPTKPSDDTYTYKFTGWDSEVTNCTGDKDYKATYSSTFIEYTVNFYNYDGTTTLKSTKYHYGDAVVEPTRTPTREKDNIYTYTFAGWNSEVTNCTGNKDYIATYTSTYIEYDVIFRDFDGMTDLKSTKYHYGDVVEEPETPTRKPTESTIYTFAGWDKEVTICTGTRVYRATYSATPRQYKVTFVDYDDSILKEETLYNYGTSASDIVLPTTPSRTSTNGKYEFIGWKPAVSNVNSDVVYKAKYETIYERNGNSIYFGKYPQSLVTDEKIINKLLFNSGYYPTESDPFQWTPYEYYYRGSINTHFMYYQDIDLDNDGINDYRGVYFSSYRPKYIYGSDSDSSQRSNGFYTKEVYWFSYDLIEWKILNENDGKLLIVTNLCLDAKEFYPSDSEYFNHNGKNGYSNNYELSEIRKILNDDFYNFAFNDLQRSLIEIAEIDNSIDSTKYCDSKYICQNTSDKIFLLSYKEADTYFTYNENRRTTATAYAKCQGLEINGGYARWWTRSPRDPYNNSKPVVIYVDHGQNTAGAVVDGGYTYYLNGVRPACWINISQLNETN